MPISDTGYWILTEKEFNAEHAHDPSLSAAICDICPTKRVYDFGCGPGNYVRDMRTRGIEAFGFDGNPVTSSFPYCTIADLTSPTFHIEPVEFLVCLEVGEHIPKEYETDFISTLDRHVLPGGMVVLSWAVPGQGGYGHVNCQTNDYVRSKFIELGYYSLPHLDNTLRSKASLSWFKNTIMVFRKRPILHTDLSGGLGNQLFKICNLASTGQQYCICRRHPTSSSDYSQTLFQHLSSNCTGNVETIDCSRQSYKHIAGVIPSIVSKLSFGIEAEPTDAAFLHIRGGDYIGHPLHWLGMEGYYERAVKHFPEDTLFYIFTNDRNYAESFEFLNRIRHEFIECSEIEGLLRMKHCKRGGICANSSYSWWGAVMDMNRTLVIPSRWTNDLHWNESSDYVFPGAIVEDVPLDVFCIHLAHRDDRLQHIESLRTKYPSLRIHIVDAIHDTDGVRGCVLSHKKAIRSRTAPYTIVIEDDCVFLLPEKQLIDSLYSAISYISTHPNVDIVNGCGNLPLLSASAVDSHGTLKFLQSKDVRTSHCMIYRSSAYQKILAFDEHIPLDIQTNTTNMVFTYPYIATQLPSYSDIAKVYTEYNNIEVSRKYVEGLFIQQTPHKSINPPLVGRIPIWSYRV